MKRYKNVDGFMSQTDDNGTYVLYADVERLVASHAKLLAACKIALEYEDYLIESVHQQVVAAIAFAEEKEPKWLDAEDKCDALLAACKDALELIDLVDGSGGAVIMSGEGLARLNAIKEVVKNANENLTSQGM